MANINIVDPAIVTDDPVKPQKLKNIILGLLVGCMLGVGLAFFREYFDDTVKDADTAKQRLGYPILSIIPYIKPSQTGGGPWHPTLITHRDPRCISAESFRTLRTSIHFSVAGEARKVILITSTFPGEGKTTMVANLAVALSQAGKRVMVLDCDLRRPALHAMFGQSQSPGLSSVLAGDITVEQAVHKTDIPRLDFISSGITPPNPLELLGSQRMRDLLERLKECYDVVLIDAPPVLAVSDAPVLTSLADLILVVLEVGRVPVKLALRTKEILSSTGVSVAGIILNDRDGKGEGYGYYGSGYCSYGYGYEEKVKKGRWRKFFSF